MAKIIKRIFLVISIVALSLVIITALIAYFILPLYLSSESGKAFLESKMSEALHGKVTIAKTNMSWTGGLKVVGLNIDNAMLSDMKIWLNVNEVELVPSYITLLSNSVVISSFTLKEPHIEVEFIKDKKQLPHQSNLSTKQQSKVKKDGSIEPSKGFSVKATSITDGNIRFRDRSYPDFTHINLNGNIEIQSNEIDSGISSFSMNIQNGSVKGSGFYIAEMGN